MLTEHQQAIANHNPLDGWLVLPARTVFHFIDRSLQECPVERYSDELDALRAFRSYVERGYLVRVYP